jgi:hypothetical protein
MPPASELPMPKSQPIKSVVVERVWAGADGSTAGRVEVGAAVGVDDGVEDEVAVGVEGVDVIKIGCQSSNARCKSLGEPRVTWCKVEAMKQIRGLF